MSLFECRTQFQTGLIDKPGYIDAMFNLHSRLFEYSNFIKNTDIASIEIQEAGLIITLKPNGIKLMCESLDKRTAPIETLNFNAYEPVEANMVFRLLDPHMVFFDIGANIGWYSIQVAKHDPTIKVYSFEPIPQTYSVFNKNIALNKLTNVKPYNMGFSDNNQDLVFYFDSLASGNASARNLTDNASLQKITSKTEKLDDFFSKSKLEQLDFIKCDVEGAELLVFQGGLDVLKTHQPIIFTEMLRKWSEKFDYHPNAIIDLLAGLGYGCFTPKNDKLVRFSRMDDETIETNFFFLHQVKHAAKIQELSV